jgi:hypothetical protein
MDARLAFLARRLPLPCSCPRARDRREQRGGIVAFATSVAGVAPSESGLRNSAPA